MTNLKKSNYAQLTMIQLRSVLAKYIIQNKNASKEDGFKKPYVYIAGPWFTPKDKDVMDYLTEEVNKYVENKERVYFPIQHSYESPEETFKRNLTAIDCSDVVIALIMSKDIGTAMEIGYAKAKRTKVIAVVYDESCLYYKTNIMIAYAADEIIPLSNVISYIMGNPVSTIERKDTWEGKE